MNRLDLQKNNINYSEQPEDSDLPLHVVILRRALLDFRCTIPERLGFYEEEDYDDNQALKSRLKELGLFQRNDIVDSIKKYQATRILARGYDEGQDREAEWQSFFMNRFLKPLSDQMAIKEDDSRRYEKLNAYVLISLIPC